MPETIEDIPAQQQSASKGTECDVALRAAAMPAKQLRFDFSGWGNKSAFRCLLLLSLPFLLHMVVQAPAEPIFNGDANRHVMTSVFFHDFLIDAPLSHPKQYAVDYFEQYPALGLLVWPPLFHAVAGALMTVFGTSVLVPRLLVFASFVLAAVCLYRVCRRRVSTNQSVSAVALFSILPMIFEFSRYVMLEMPTLGLCLFCIERFDQWLATDRTRDLYFAAILAALAALTRFDAVVLIPVLCAMILVAGQGKRLFHRHVPGAAIVALILFAPTYVVIWNEMGDLHLRQASENVSGTASQMLATGSLSFYPQEIPIQVGWMATLFFVVGLVAAFRKQHRSASAVFGILLICTYVTFTPLAELSSRHAIYWLPAVSYFAVVGAGTLVTLLCSITDRRLACSGLVYTVLFGSTAWATLATPVHFVVGYAEAVEVAIEHTQVGEVIFVDGWWDGNVTYHVRHLDPERTRRVVRGDRLLYDFTNVPTVDFEQFVESDTEILQAIVDATPSCILFEDPQPYGAIPVSKRMRRLVQALPKAFPPLRVVRVQSTVPAARQFQLRVFDVDLPALRAHVADVKSNTTTQRDSSESPDPARNQEPKL